jgi:hypothetical protein
MRRVRVLAATIVLSMSAGGLLSAATAKGPTLKDDTVRPRLPVDYTPLKIETAFDLAAVAPADAAAAKTLVDRLAAGAALVPADIVTAEAVANRNRNAPVAWALLRAVHGRAAEQARASRNAPVALEHLRRVAGLDASADVEVNVLVVLLEQDAWAEAEREAQAVSAHRPDDVRGALALAFALLRQDRASEAYEVLQAALEVEDSKRVRQLLALVQRALASEQGMSEARQWHFHVLYEGTPDPILAKALTARLESHYATLAGVFGFEPATTVPVVLFTKERYHSVTGAPHWSGGAYNVLDGRIRVPAGGLTADALGEIDGTLLHELVHAFIAERTHGAAPRLLHEALAQYYEGERVTSKLDFETLGALGEGRLGGVGGFYMEALSFGEYLVQLAGQNHVNDLLTAIGEAENVDAGFQKVYGRDYKEMREDWKIWAREQYR